MELTIFTPPDTGNSIQRAPSSKLNRLIRRKSTKNWIHKFIKPLIRPVRILQFLVVLLLFALVIYTTALGDVNVSSITCILLTVLSAVYAMVLAIDIISQLGGGELQSIPMFIFSLLGMMLFGIAGILLISLYSAVALWYILTILCLSLLTCVLFAIDVVTVLVFWKQNCEYCKERYCTDQTKILFQKSELCHPACSETVKYDLMTSVSSIKVPSGDEEAAPDHSQRKIGYGHRRQYVDCPTSARSIAVLEVANIQTEPNATCNIQSQTQREMKEMPVQTLSKCELCNRQIPMYSTSVDPAQQAMQQTPCTTCPALMQLMHRAPCCPGCRCVTGIIQVSQQGQQQQTQGKEQSKDQKPIKGSKQRQQTVDEKSYEIVTSDQEDPEMKGRQGTITKLTLASYSVTPNQTTDNSCQTTTAKDVKNAKKTSEPPNEKKVKINLEKREKEEVKEATKKLQETLVPEKEKSKTTNNSARKLSKTIPKKPPDPGKRKSMESEKKLLETVPKIAEKTLPVGKIEEETSETIAKEDVQTKNSLTLPDIKPLISPPMLVAEMIDRLQEIEGNKQDVLPTNETAKKEASGLKSSKAGNNETQKVGETDAAKSTQNSQKTVDYATVRKLTLKSEDSGIDSSNVTIESNKLSTSHKTSRDSSNTDGSSDKNRLKPDDKKRGQNKVERSSDSVLIPNPHMGTQTSDADTPTSSNKSKRTHVFQKKNKVEPAEVTHTDTDVQTLGYEAQSENSLTENRRTFQAKGIDICSACKRIQVPTTSSYFHYYSVYKDKRGRFYCEFCATPNSIKVLYKNGNEYKRLKCAGCRNFIRTKPSYDLQDEIARLGSRSKLDNCPKCGQTQVQIASVSSN